MSEVRSVDVLDLEGKKAATVDLPAEIFDVPTNIPLMHPPGHPLHEDPRAGLRRR